METLILLRHGESTYSAEKRANGDPRILVPLTEKGRAQAWRARAELNDDIGYCVVSQFLRTIETADIALAGRSIPYHIAADVDDVLYGVFEGKPLDDYRRWAETHGARASVPGGESREDIARRIARALQHVIDRPEPVILLVSHDKILSDILNAAAGIPLPVTSDHLPNAQPYRLERTQVERAQQTLATIWSTPSP